MTIETLIGIAVVAILAFAVWQHAIRPLLSRQDAPKGREPGLEQRRERYRARGV